MLLMEYENQMFLDAFHDDGLTIVAQGLGIERVFLNFVKLYCDPGNLVLVLNTTAKEEEYFVEQLQDAGTNPLPKVLTTEYNANERNTLYMEGGVIFVTSRILVVDLLTDKVPIHLITGILVYRAHKIIESCQEAFILRLYRQKNKTGFVKAFSDSSQSFTAGFCRVERVMRSLFVRKLFLWPRFHASVVDFFGRHKIDVVEIQIQMTGYMVSCQRALLDLIDACIKELKRGNPSLDTDEFTVENAISRDFDMLVHLHLDPVWHQLSTKSKQLVADIKTLRLLLEYLTQYDCVNFYNLVQSVRTNEKVFGSSSVWLFLDAAESLFMNAKQRVFGPVELLKKQKKSDDKDVSSKGTPLLLEECPKWEALKEVLQEIHDHCKAAPDPEAESPASGSNSVLVCAADDRSCNQLREYLCDGGRAILERLYNKTVSLKSGGHSREQQQSTSEGHIQKRKPKHNPGTELTLTQMMSSGYAESDLTKPSSDKQRLDKTDATYCGILDDVMTVLHPLHGGNDPFSFVKTLRDLQPRYVVLYDADMSFVRQLEVYKAINPSKPLRVYFLMYTDSTEEQRYLTSLRKEKEAFEYLIKAKSTMVIPEEREGRDDDDVSLSRDTTTANQTVNKRKAGKQDADVQQKVIVDMREFRSELPSLIHRRGIDIEPVTLTIGDYILSPEICVERKSLSDLIGSLNNGRLYNQCVMMCRYYPRPVLLIEFDPQKSFSLLQGRQTLSPELSNQDLTSKLALLTICFPSLRILWCQSPYTTAELFEEIKSGREEPNAAQAMSVGADSDLELRDKYALTPQEMLRKMPGVTSKNIFALMNQVDSIADLVTLTLDKLKDVLKSDSHATQLYTFLHSDQKQRQLEAMATGRSAPDSKTRKPKFFKKNIKKT